MRPLRLLLLFLFGSAVFSPGLEAQESPARPGSGGVISVRLLDPTGVRIGSATVEIGGKRQKGTGEGGVFRFEDLEPGEYTVEVKAYGFRPAWVHAAVAKGGTTEITVRLDPGATVEGIVVDSAGRPVAGATVWVSPIDGEDPDPEGGRELRTLSAESDAGGRFRLSGLPPREAKVEAWRGRPRDPSRLRLYEEVCPRLPARDLRLVLKPDSCAVVRLLTPGGEPFAESSSTGVVTSIWRRGECPSLSTEYRGSEDGVFVFYDLRAAEYEVVIETRDFVPVVLRFTSHPYSRLDLGSVALDPGLPVRGRVTGPDGAPLSEARVVVTFARRGVPPADVWLPTLALKSFVAGNWVWTDEDGSFLIEHVPAGRVFVEASKEGFAGAPKDVQVAPDLDAVAIRLTEGAKVWCAIRTKDGSPAAGRRLLAERRGEDGTVAFAPRREIRMADDEGRAGFRLTTGPWRIYEWTYKKGETPRETLLGEWTFVEGETYHLDLVLP